MTRASSDATQSGRPANSPGLVGRPANGVGSTFDWAALVPRVIHPDKVAIIEALHFVGLPMAALDLHIVLDDERALSHISYHVRALADFGVIRKVSQRKRRGALQKFYVLR